MNKELIDLIKKWYAKRNIYSVKVELGTFGKWKDKTVKVQYSKNNIDTFTELFTDRDINNMVREL